MVLPKTNLVNGLNNEVVYNGRVADELVRYKRIKTFILQPKSYLNLSDIKYKLHKNEIILLESILFDPNYYKNIKYIPINQYITNHGFDTSMPVKSQMYSNSVELKSQGDMGECSHPTKVKLLGKWKSVFPPQSFEFKFSNDHPACSFDIILILIKQHYTNKTGKSATSAYKDTFTLTEIKELLIDQYNMYYSNHSVNILKILHLQGKKNAIKKVLNKDVVLGDVIMSVDYSMTTLDLWLILLHFKIPTVLYSSTKLMENKKQLLVINPENKKELYFIHSPSFRPEIIPQYRLLITQDERALIPINELSPFVRKEINEKNNTTTMETFLTEFN